MTSERGVLLTQFNSRTAIPGRWGLPGGGLDEGEDPVDGVHREVWEETGQEIELGALVTIQSQHWVGRAPAASSRTSMRCASSSPRPASEPGEPVIHDVGGTTSDARWFTRAEVAGLSMSTSWRDLAALSEAVSDGP